jgi:hypothetical protein
VDISRKEIKMAGTKSGKGTKSPFPPKSATATKQERADRFVTQEGDGVSITFPKKSSKKK